MSIRLFLSSLALCMLMACSEQSGGSSANQQNNEATVVASESASATASLPGNKVVELDLYKSPTCGCCGKWADHASEGGFSLATHHPADMNKLKAEYGIAAQYQSCHTAVSKQGYVFEGHIPARYVRQFLAAPPADALGLAVPAMPMGSPGMEMGERFTPYRVLLLKKDGSAEVFAEVTALAQQYQ